ncbi:MAG: hypothetical protein F6K26_29805, partial [Moorea sp. SIO2I5]|nr:hypothetical protein [Moorena sp. SIO2I5]
MGHAGRVRSWEEIRGKRQKARGKRQELINYRAILGKVKNGNHCLDAVTDGQGQLLPTLPTLPSLSRFPIPDSRFPIPLFTSQLVEPFPSKERTLITLAGIPTTVAP